LQWQSRLLTLLERCWLNSRRPIPFPGAGSVYNSWTLLRSIDNAQMFLRRNSVSVNDVTNTSLRAVQNVVPELIINIFIPFGVPCL
jgi:hypothetical protein